MINKVVINNLELTPANGYYVSAIKDLGYKTKYPVSSVAYIHGSKIGEVYLTNRQIAFELKIISDDMVATRSALYKALTIQEFTSDLLSVQIHLQNGIVLTCDGVIKDLNSDINSQMYGASDVAFVFETESPFFKSQQQYQKDITITKGGGLAIPAAIPYVQTAGATGYSSVSQGGNVFCYPEIYFYGALTNPVLTNVTTGKSISLTASIYSPNYYYVDTFNRIVTDHLGVNKRDKMTGDFIVLQPNDNQFSLMTDTPAETGYVRIVYKNFYIGI